MTCPYLRNGISGPGGRWSAGKGMKIGKSTRAWTHPVPASTSYDSSCLAPSKLHFLNGCPGESEEAVGVAEISYRWDYRCLKENEKFIYVLLSHEVSELACSGVGIFSCERGETQHDPGGKEV